MGVAKGVMIGIVVLIIIGVVVASAVQIVDAGHRGVLLHWNAVDLTAAPLSRRITLCNAICRLCSSNGD